MGMAKTEISKLEKLAYEYENDHANKYSYLSKSEKEKRTKKMTEIIDRFKSMLEEGQQAV